ERRKHSCRLHCAPRQRTFLPMLVYRACTRTARPSAVPLPLLHGLRRHRSGVLDMRSLGQKIADSEPPQKQISLNHRSSGTGQPFVSNSEDSPETVLLNKENPTWRGAARRESFHPVKVLIACILTMAGVPAPA